MVLHIIYAVLKFRTLLKLSIKILNSNMAVKLVYFPFSLHNSNFVCSAGCFINFRIQHNFKKNNYNLDHVDRAMTLTFCVRYGARKTKST